MITLGLDVDDEEETRSRGMAQEGQDEHGVKSAALCHIGAGGLRTVSTAHVSKARARPSKAHRS